MPRTLVLALALVSTGLALSHACSAETLSSKPLNYAIELPTHWSTQTATDAWAKDGIVAGARRVLDKLYDGKPATGQAAQMHLTVQDAPADKTAADLAADPLQREFMLRLFGATAQWPAVETETTTIVGENGEAQGVRLIAKGTSINLQSAVSPCRAMLIVAVVKKKLYRLRLVAWTTQYDDEGLGSDLDAIDVNFQLLDVKEEKAKPPRPPGAGPDGADPADDRPVEGDSGEEKPVVDDIQGWRFVKPKGLVTREIDKEAQPYMVVSLGANDQEGSVDITLSAHPNGLVTNGRQVPDQDIRKWITTSWWQIILANYPNGALETFDWPANRPNTSFLTLPKFDKPFMIAETPKKRELEPSAGDIEKKFRMVESVKGSLGKEKASDPWRGVCKGNRERIGPEITLRYAWRTAKFTYMLNVSFAREGGVARHGEATQKFLQSFELTR